MAVNIIAVVDAMEGEVRKGPSSGIEAIPLIDKRGCEFPFAMPLPKHSLPAIGVSQPFVHGKDSRECLTVSDLAKEALGKVVVDRPFSGIAHIAGCKL